MNVVDTFLVLLSATETWILPFTQSCSGNQNLRILVTLRIVRILRVVRFFRLIKTFEQLWLIVSGLVSALKTVVWVLLLQLLLIYMCAIFATTQIGSPTYFSSVTTSMISLWQIATLDDWADSIVRPTVQESPALILFFVPFLFLSTFGILNVIVGIVVENTVQSAQRKSESQQREEEMLKQTALDALRRILLLSDPNGEGVIRKSDLAAIAGLAQVGQKLKIIGITIADLERIFGTIAAHDDSMQVTDLICAIAQVSGSAFQKDLGQVTIVLNGLTARILSATQQIESTDVEIQRLRDDVESFKRRTMYYITGSRLDGS